MHDRLDQAGGAERMLWTLHHMFPAAPIFTAMWNRSAVPRFNGCDIRTTWMQGLPGIQRAPRVYAALYPLAFASLELRGFELVISLTTSFAKGIRTAPDSQHICYCNSPANFIWRPHAYFTRASTRMVTTPLRAWLWAWDRRAGRRPDLYVTSCRSVADRIRSAYGQEAAIVPPPLETKWFVPHQSDDFYLAVGRLVAHKRVELAIQACAQLGAPLWIAGEGRAAQRLRQLAGPNVRFLGHVSDETLRELYARARAVLVCAEEDFGLVPLEAQAAGTPVVAYDAGGVRETVIDGDTGVRFAPQTVEALAAAMTRAADKRWDRQRIQSHAALFEEDHFRHELSRLIERRLDASRHAVSAGLQDQAAGANVEAGWGERLSRRSVSRTGPDS